MQASEDGNVWRGWNVDTEPNNQARNTLTVLAAVFSIVATIILILQFFGITHFQDMFAKSALGVAATSTTTHVDLPSKTQTSSTPLPVQPTSTTYMDCGSYVDLGNAQSESGHDVTGWAGTYTNQPPSPSGDTSFRYQPKRSPAHVMLCVAQVHVNYTLTTEVQDFGCDDSFEIFLNTDPNPVFRFAGTRANVVRTHYVAIPSSEVSSRDVILGFESTSSDCGYASVYNVGLAPS